MKAGRLNKRITFQQNVPTQSASGEPVESWSNLKAVWAGVKQIKESERFKLEQSAAFEVAEFTVRYDPDLNDYKLRIVYNGKTFDVMGINEIQNQRGWIITGRAQV